jgi:hypothetical protein
MDAVEAKKPVATAAGGTPAKTGVPSKVATSTGNDKKANEPALAPSSSFSASSTADRQFVVNLLIHTSDLSGQGIAPCSLHHFSDSPLT